MGSSWGPSYSRPAMMCPGILGRERGQVQGCLGNGITGQRGQIGCGDEGQGGIGGLSRLVIRVSRRELTGDQMETQGGT